MISEELNKEAAGHSAKTLNNSYELLRTVLKKYRPDFRLKLDLPEVYPTVSEMPLVDDLRKIYAITYDTEMEIPILLACWLGLRVSEIRGLKCSKILDDKIIIDNAIVQGNDGAAKKKTKTRTSTRVLPLQHI